MIRIILTCFVLMLLPNSANTAAIPVPGSGLGYTCTDNPGEKKTCTCTGAADCWWMGRSGVCEGDVIVLTCGNDGKCTCDWKKNSITPPGSRLIEGKDKLFIIEMN